MTRIVDKFFAELDRLGIPMKKTALLGGVNVVNLRRLKRGETDTLDVEVVGRVARRLLDPKRFILAVFDSAFEPGAPVATALPMPAPGSIENGAHLLVDNGDVVPAPRGLAEAVSDVTAQRFASPLEAIRHATHYNGWAGWQAANGVGELHYDRDSVDPGIVARLIDMIRMHRNIVRYRIRDGRKSEQLLTVEETVLLLGRRVRAAKRPPDGWIDETLPYAELDPAHRELVDRFDRGATGGDALFPLLETGRASLYSIIPEDREAHCIDIGRAWDVPTRTDVGKRVLDRKDNIVYSAMIDRHIVAAASAEKPTATRLGVDFGNGRRVIYDRLALPFAMGSTSCVLTTSTIREDTGNRIVVSTAH